MELVDGGDLESFVERHERIAPERARALMIQVARGLRDAQTAGIIHPDIKPSNLLIEKNGSVKTAASGNGKGINGKVDATATQVHVLL